MFLYMYQCLFCICINVCSYSYVHIGSDYSLAKSWAFKSKSLNEYSYQYMQTNTVDFNGMLTNLLYTVIHKF